MKKYAILIMALALLVLSFASSAPPLLSLKLK
jgi:hypothetical protein